MGMSFREFLQLDKKTQLELGTINEDLVKSKRKRWMS